MDFEREFGRTGLDSEDQSSTRKHEAVICGEPKSCRELPCLSTGFHLTRQSEPERPGKRPHIPDACDGHEVSKVLQVELVMDFPQSHLRFPALVARVVLPGCRRLSGPQSSGGLWAANPAPARASQRHAFQRPDPVAVAAPIPRPNLQLLRSDGLGLPFVEDASGAITGFEGTTLGGGPVGFYRLGALTLDTNALLTARS